MVWNPLVQIDQLDQIIESSYKTPQVIFKHSTSCSISSMAKMRIEDKWKNVNNDIQFHYLDLLMNRQLSNEVAEKLGVYHESPQLILIINGEAEYDASHFDISIEELQESLSYLNG